VAHSDGRRGPVGEELTGIEVAGKKLVLLNVDGGIRAFGDRCPYLSSRLSEGLSSSVNRTGASRARMCQLR
jgi:nitrite reductase/ring-hydroxylating ferredoxin subunit